MTQAEPVTVLGAGPVGAAIGSERPHTAKDRGFAANGVING